MREDSPLSPNAAFLTCDSHRKLFFQLAPSLQADLFLLMLLTNAANLAMDGLRILAVTMTNGNSRMKHVRARLPLVSQTVTFPRQLSNSS